MQRGQQANETRPTPTKRIKQRGKGSKKDGQERTEETKLKREECRLKMMIRDEAGKEIKRSRTAKTEQRGGEEETKWHYYNSC